MKCYDFELNISAYIEGELKQVVRHSFNEHKENCSLCNEKLTEISQIVLRMSELTPLNTSTQFIHNLNKKINNIDKQSPSIWKRLKQFRPLGFSPAPALGFALSIILIISASYMLISVDKLPEIKMGKLSTQSSQNTTKSFIPSVVIPTNKASAIADFDSSGKIDKRDLHNRYNDKIKLTGGK